jgi:hypothetical protein
MNFNLLKSISLFLLLSNVFFISAISAQSVNGLWYGVGRVSKFGDTNTYLSELKLKQSGKKVSGEFNYFFRRVEIKTKISGTYDSKTRTLLLNTNPVLNFQAKNENGADCPMYGVFTLTASRVETTLSGQFLATSKYKITCPDITIKFVKGIYEEPRPLDTTAEEPITTVPQPQVKKQIDPNEGLVAALNKRVFDVTPVIDVDADSLKVTLYDNGEVDNDTISLFYNRKLVAAKKMLSDKPLTFMLPIDTSINEIAMYADNLGKLPPNTALAVIYAGDKRYELGLTSTFMKNATIRFRRKIKQSDPKNIN